MKRSNKGFTLIELLVVITIIGILATGAVTVYTSQIQKARDTTRIADIKAVQSSVEQAYQDTSDYPDADVATFNGTVVDYMPNVPSDAKHADNCEQSVCGYVYSVTDSNGDGSGIDNAVYELSTAMENSGNVTNRGDADNGDDAVRLEVSNNPAVAPETTWAIGSTAPVTGSIGLNY